VNYPDDCGGSSLKGWICGISIVVVVVFVAGFMMWAIPTWNVWQRELAGQAQLKEAEWTRKIKIEEANAEFEAAKKLAKAEVERAKGVAEANQILGKSLDENENYLRYLWVQGLAKAESVVYVPTEANLPLFKKVK